MNKIIGVFLFLIGLTASFLEIYSFASESPWVIGKFNTISSWMTDKEESTIPVTAQHNIPIVTNAESSPPQPLAPIDMETLKKEIKSSKSTATPADTYLEIKTIEPIAILEDTSSVHVQKSPVRIQEAPVSSKKNEFEQWETKQNMEFETWLDNNESF
ncbi:MAG: hypothetical protein KAH77_04770 [Thiomargarita sp.]|nr:hypothetical protein [Thiomargarita sp.]